MPINEDILVQVDTKFDHYEVVERQYEGRLARVLFSGLRRSAQSGIGLDDDPDLLFDYNQRILELANNLYPKRILVIGGGAFTLPMALASALPEAVVDVIELDSGLQSIAEQYFGLQTSDRLHLHFGDGRDYIEQTKDEYDLIIIDVFTELSIPRPFLTIEFSQLLRDRLQPGGCIVMNIIATIQGRTTGLIKSQLAAYSQSFDTVNVFPAAYGLTGWLPQNLLLVAQVQPAQDITHYVRYAAVELPSFESTDAIHDDSTA